MTRTVIAAGDDDAKTLLSIYPADRCEFKAIYNNVQVILGPIIINSERDKGLPLLSSMIGGDIVCELDNLQACASG